MMSGKTIAELSNAMGLGQFDSESQLQTMLTNITNENPDRHIFTHTLASTAQEAARESDLRRQALQTPGLLEGLPVAIKDNIQSAGYPTTAGTQYDFSHLLGEDAAVVERLKAAGAVIVGKLNMDEGALGATNNNPFWGQCDNPRLPGMTPGGSSGGSAAAVAIGWVPLTLGSDTLGSVRIPAAYCGVWGLKPTKGLISMRGMVSLSTTLDCIGPLSNCVDDLAIAVDVLAGFDTQDPQSIEAPPNWRAGIKQYESLEGIQLGALNWQGQIECEDTVKQKFNAMLEAAKLAGAAVTPVTLDAWQATQARRAAFLIAEAECANWLTQIIEQNEVAFSDGFKAMIRYGNDVSGEELARAYQYLDELKHTISQTMDSVDAMLMPTVPQQAFLQSGPVPANQADFTALANMGNCPAVAFPLNTVSTGVPVSAQVMGKAYSEAQVLGIARLLSILNPD